MFKRVNYKLWNNTFWVVINYSTPIAKRNSSSLIHIKLDKTSFFFFMDLVFLKTIEFIFFLFYFLFEIFPVLLLVLILISHFYFILIWFNLGFWWLIAGGTSKQLGMSLKILGRGKTMAICTFCEIFAEHVKFMAHFAWGAKILHTLRK